MKLPLKAFISTHMKFGSKADVRGHKKPRSTAIGYFVTFHIDLDICQLPSFCRFKILISLPLPVIPLSL